MNACMKPAWTLTRKSDQQKGPLVAAGIYLQGARIHQVDAAFHSWYVWYIGTSRHSEQDMPGLLGLISSDLFLG